jgi:hypothetical protein
MLRRPAAGASLMHTVRSVRCFGRVSDRDGTHKRGAAKTKLAVDGPPAVHLLNPRPRPTHQPTFFSCFFLIVCSAFWGVSR